MIEEINCEEREEIWRMIGKIVKREEGDKEVRPWNKIRIRMELKM